MPRQWIIALVVAGLAAGVAACWPGGRDDRICLIADLRFFSETISGCRSQEDFVRAYRKTYEEGDFAYGQLKLYAPDDRDEQTVSIAGCADYDRHATEGWYALTRFAMDREAQYRKVCGALRALSQAAKPRMTVFTDGRLGAGGVSALDQRQLPSFSPDVMGENAYFLDGVEGVAATPGSGDGVWELRYRGVVAELRETAHADFNGDGVGDILVTIFARPEGGRLPYGEVGYVSKPRPGARATYTPVNR